MFEMTEMPETQQFRVTPDDGDLDIAHLRERYSFIGKILSRFELSRSGDPAEQQAVIDGATRRYHQARMETRIAQLGAEDMPGWRAAVLMRDRRDFFFAGVRADGRIVQGKTRGWEQTERLDPAEIGRRAAAAFDAMEAGRTERRPTPFANEAPSGPPADRVDEQAWLTLSPRSLRSRERVDTLVTQAAAAVSSAAADHPAENHIYSILRGTLAKREAARFGSLSSHLMRSLDPEVQHLVRATATYETGFANWLAGASPTGEVEGEARDLARNRRQAVRAYPVLARAFLGGARHDGAISQAIDTGAELSRALGEEYGLKPATLRRLQGLSWQKAGRSAYREPRRFLREVGTLDPNHVPDSRKGFADLSAAAGAAEEFARLTGEDRREILAQQGGRIGAIAAALEGNPATGMYDMQEYIRDKVVLPGVIQRLHEAGASREQAIAQAETATDWHAGIERDDLEGRSLVRGHSLRSALTASARWHRALPRLEAALVTEGAQDRWEPLTSGIVARDGIEIVELSSALDLKREGVSQNHCVGGYSEEVKGGTALIFSVRKGDATLSTIEVDPVSRDAEGRNDFPVQQNMGHGNTPPGKEARRGATALRRHLRALPQAEISAYHDGLSLARDEDRRILGAEALMKRRVGYDPFDRARLKTAWAGLQEFLPKPMRKKGLDALVAAHMPKRRAAAPRGREPREDILG